MAQSLKYFLMLQLPFVISCYAHCDHGNTFDVDISGSSSNCSQSDMFSSESTNFMLCYLLCVSSGTQIKVLPMYSQSTTTFSHGPNTFSENVFKSAQLLDEEGPVKQTISPVLLQLATLSSNRNLRQ